MEQKRSHMKNVHFLLFESKKSWSLATLSQMHAVPINSFLKVFLIVIDCLPNPGRIFWVSCKNRRISRSRTFNSKRSGFVSSPSAIDTAIKCSTIISLARSFTILTEANHVWWDIMRNRLAMACIFDKKKFWDKWWIIHLSIKLHSTSY